MAFIGTAEAANRLNVIPRRVRALISSGKLKATRVGHDWIIDEKDLEALRKVRTNDGRTKQSA